MKCLSDLHFRIGYFRHLAVLLVTTFLLLTKTYAATSTYTLELSQGWNLVSGAISDMSTINNIQTSWTMFYTPFGASWSKNPSSVGENEGVWIKTSGSSNYVMITPTGVVIRIVIAEYLACEVGWRQHG